MMTPRAYPGIGHAVLMTLAFFGVQVAGGVVVGIVAMIVGGQGAVTAWAGHPAAVVIINLAAFAVVLAWGAAANGVSWRTFVPLRPLRVAAYPALVLAIAGLAIVLSEVDNVVSLALPRPDWFLVIFRKMVANDVHPGMSLFLTLVIAPTTEEILFRGMILRGLLAHTRPAIAIGVSALLFALVHANPWQFFGPLALGVLFGWWYLRTGSLVSVMVGHALGNALAAFSRYLPVEVPGFTPPPVPLPSPVHQPLSFTLAGVALLALGLWLFGRLIPRPAIPPIIGPARVTPTAG